MNFPGRTNPISQIEIEETLIHLIDELEEETEAFEKLADDAGPLPRWVWPKFIF